MADYVPPLGDSVQFNFTTPYTPAAGGQLEFDFRPEVLTLAPSGFDASSFGTATTANAGYISTYPVGIPPGDVEAPRIAVPLYPVGYHPDVYGTPTIRNQYRYLAPTGIAPGAFGTAKLNRTVLPVGISHDVYGTPNITSGFAVYPPSINDGALGTPSAVIGTQYIYPNGVVVSALGQPLVDVHHFIYPQGLNGFLGIPGVENKTRYPMPLGFSASTFSAPVVTHGAQQVSPLGHQSIAFGTALFGYTRYLVPQGFDSLRVGTAYVHSSEQYVYTTSFNGAHGVPSVVNRDRNLGAVGSFFGEYGYADVANRNRYLYPDGFYQGAVSNPYVEQEQFISIQTSGFDASRFGTTYIYNLTQITYPDGAEPGQVGQFLTVGFDVYGKVYPGGMFLTLFGDTTSARNSISVIRPNGITGAVGTPVVTDGVRRLYPPSFTPTTYGTALLTGGTQFVRLPALGIAPKGFGTAFAAYGERYIDQHSRDHATFGTPTVGTDRYILAVGFAGAFGSPTVLDNSQIAYAVGIAPAGFGDAAIALRTKYLVPRSILQPVEDVTALRVYNARQIAAQYYEVTPSDGGVFGQYHLIENSNRTLLTYGLNFFKTGNATLENTARVLLAEGFDALHFDRQDVSHYARTVYPQGSDFLTQPTRYQAIYNAARVLTPNGGIKQDAYGLPSVASNLQTLKDVGRIEASYGTAYVDYAIRTLAPYYTYEGTFSSEHRVSLGQQYVNLDTRGIPPKEVGAADAQIRFTIFYPVQFRALRMGEPTVSNRNRTLREYGYDHTEWGRPLVYNLTQYMRPNGFDAARLSTELSIGPNIKYLYPVGINRMLVSTRANVYLANPYLPFQQTISDAGGYPGDINEQRARFPKPTVRGNSLRPEGFIATQFGQPYVYANSIFPKGFYASGGISDMGDEALGTPSLNSAQFIYLSNGARREGFGNQFFPLPGDKNGIPPPQNLQIHRVDPHTIYCRFDVTQQAVDNHEGKTWRVMDHALDEIHQTGGQRPFFGNATITLRNRTIRQTTTFFSGSVEVPTVSNRVRYLVVDGIRAFKSGFANLNDGKTLRANGFDAARYGFPAAAHYEDPNGNRTLRPEGLLAFRTTSPVVTNFIRYLNPTGVAPLFGTPRVHPPEPIVPQGFDASRFGNFIGGNKIRTIITQGEDTSSFEFTFGQFNNRMRVEERGHGSSVGMGVQTQMGTPRIGDRNSRIYVSSFYTDAYSPAYVSLKNYISAAGFGLDASSFGDVDRWEAGKIKPHGDDMLLTGISKTQRVIHASGFDSWEENGPVFGRFITASGFVGDFGIPTGTHEDNGHVCGTMVRAIPAPSGVFGGFGTPGVSA